MNAVQPLFRYPRRCQVCRDWVDAGSPTAAYFCAGDAKQTLHQHCQKMVASRPYDDNNNKFNNVSSVPDRYRNFDLGCRVPATESTGGFLARISRAGNYGVQAQSARTEPSYSIASSPALAASPYSAPGSVGGSPTPPPDNRAGEAGGVSLFFKSLIGGGTASPPPPAAHDQPVHEIGFGPTPPSYTVCRDRKIGLGQLLSFPNLDVGHLFRTGLTASILVKMREKRPNVVHEFAARGMTSDHIMRALAADQTYTAVHHLPFTRSEWRALGVTTPSKINMSDATWLALDEGAAPRTFPY